MRDSSLCTSSKWPDVARPAESLPCSVRVERFKFPATSAAVACRQVATCVRLVTDLRTESAQEVGLVQRSLREIGS